MILEGTQPTLTQVPPITPRSIKVTRAPNSAAFSAPAIAAPPLPMTAMWVPPSRPSAPVAGTAGTFARVSLMGTTQVSQGIPVTA